MTGERRRIEGFTLVELIAALSIFALLVAAAMNYASITTHVNAIEAECLQTHLSQIDSALKEFYAARDDYPDSQCTPYPSDVRQSCLPDFIPSFLLAAPKTTSCCPWANTVYYQYVKSGSQVSLCFKTQQAPDKDQWAVLLRIKEKQADGKVYISTAGCAETSDFATPLPDTPPAVPVYLTWWVAK